MSFAKYACFALTLCGGLAVLGQSAAPTPAELRQAAQPTSDSTWWKHAVFYEIYPRSFQDSNGDGIGDLNGITQRMGYLQQLGIDAIWIAPMYPSPQVDFGYDISDYESVDPQYGSMADFDRLQSEAKGHGIRVILDMVLNHTSDRHAWFVESAQSRSNPKADWYVWNDGIPATSPGLSALQKRYAHEGRVPPNNWESNFGRSAWEWVPARRQFYYHKFYVQQPDLNWRNPAVEAAMFSTMRFWLDRGVAGFRLDAVPTLFEDPQLRNEAVEGGLNEQGDPKLREDYTSNLPDVHAVMRRMRSMVSKYPGDRVLMGETYLPNTAALTKWYGGAAQDELHLPMDLLVGFGKREPGSEALDAAYFRRFITEAETELSGAQPLFVFDNHDNVRSIDRFGDGAHNVAIARCIATMLLTTKSSAMTYYGAELGMPTTTPVRREDVKDPEGITGWPKEKGRDGERTPMQWTPGPQAGFSTNPQTWLPIPDSYKSINVQTETADTTSLLHWYQQLIALRRSLPALHDGGIRMLDQDSNHVLAWVRIAGPGEPSAVIAVNLSPQPQTIALDLSAAGLTANKVRTIAATDASLQGVTTLQSVILPPFASWIASLQ